jgi:Amt family ammonium transporter
MKKLWSILAICLMLTFLIVPVAFGAEGTDGAAAAAAEAPKIDAGDTAWVLASAALVMLMTPGLALFYGGMVRTKNVLTTIMQSFFVVALISVQWVLIGYTLTFGSDIGGLIGSLEYFGLNGLGQEPSAIAATIPSLAFVAFQCMFAVITPALITGSFAERMKFPAFVVFIVAWATLVYNPFAHWVWGGGWLFELGALDFAGGTVIHILSGVSGLVACIVLGRRRGYGSSPMLPHHLPMTVLGAALLWFGWFGFNAGSALAANGLAASAFVVTQVAAAAATLSWVFVEWMHNGKPTILGAVSGCIAGLVAITPAAGFVSTIPSLIIGLAGGAICYFAVAVVKKKLNYDDSLDAFGIHGIGGTWGAIATGLFASKSVNSAGTDGFFFGGGMDPVVTQLIAVAAAWVFAAVMTFILLKIVGAFLPLRVNDEEEISGLDVSEHGERAYAQDFVAGAPITHGYEISSTQKVAEKVNLV